ncbi:hypothetical protein GDO86_016453 [Hymenochirus boettgeri]|uniref:G-protein coupled receptors family 3 profile domain-containing protein n=1 Tax=Hymenochirus boettgeri TaxID=247094 RepID=A0A8T2K1B0_9PIPI|nr:hypothetical protein GDO86_016453 [Hymenochirus boettgeri]
MTVAILLGLCVCETSLEGCRLPSDEGIGYSLAGDIILGGLFPVHIETKYPETHFRESPKPLQCSRFHIRYYRFLLAMVYAVMEINESNDLLPNVTLGFRLYDSCFNELISLMGATRILSGKKESVPNYNCNKDIMPLAIVGDYPSKASMPIARILGLYRYPQISYGSGLPFLSNKLHFPSFLRTIYNADFEAYAIGQLVKYFNWTWVGIIFSDNDFGWARAQGFTKEFETIGGCIAFQEILPVVSSIEAVFRIIDVIKKSSARVIIVYCTIENLISLMEEASFHNITNKVWVSTSSWSITSDFPRKEILITLNGSLAMPVRSGKIPGFKEFLYSIHPSIYPDDIFMKTFWENAFHCVWPGQDLYNNTSSSVLNKDIAWKRTIQKWILCQYYNYQPWQLLHYIRRVNFTNTGGERIYFDKNGDAPINVDIVNWQLFPNGSNQYVHVGYYDAGSLKGHELDIQQEKILWNGGNNQVPLSICSDPCPKGNRRATIQGQMICCFDCVPCSDGEILNPYDETECVRCSEDKWPDSRKEKCLPKPIQFLSYQEMLGSSLACVSILFCLVTLSVFSLFIIKHQTPIVKANNRELSYLLLISLMFGFLCSLSFIGRPNLITCMIRQVIFAIIFSVCLSVILAKTITVILIFSATNPNSRLNKLVGLRLPVYIVPVCTIIQIILCVVWLAKAPPFVEFNMTAEIKTIVIVCNEGSTVLFACVLGYMGLLATISLLVAFLARKLPDTFNETKFITFSMLVFASVWVTFIPAYLSTKGKQMVAVEIFAILSSSAGLLVCIFFPKCYIILLHPEINSKEFITGRNHRDRAV